jgi:hypothetical protein
MNTSIGIFLAISVFNRDSNRTQDMISAIAACYSEQDAVNIVRPALEIFTPADREWFDEVMKNARWH